MHDPICYAYEADHHCPTCAEKRFGRCEEHNQIACCVEDGEGNTPGAVAPWDEWMNIGEGNQSLVCGDCGEVIEEYEEEEEEEASTERRYKAYAEEVWGEEDSDA